jgi:hypothetical protein
MILIFVDDSSDDRISRRYKYWCWTGGVRCGEFYCGQMMGIMYLKLAVKYVTVVRGNITRHFLGKNLLDKLQLALADSQTTSGNNPVRVMLTYDQFVMSKNCFETVLFASPTGWIQQS